MNSSEDGECSSNVDDLLVSGPIRKRRFSNARIQPTRIKKIMQSDEEIGRMVASVPVAIGSAMEHFAAKVLEAAASCVPYSSSRTLSPMHIKYAIMQNPHFAFFEFLTNNVCLPKFDEQISTLNHVEGSAKASESTSEQIFLPAIGSETNLNSTKQNKFKVLPTRTNLDSNKNSMSPFLNEVNNKTSLNFQQNKNNADEFQTSNSFSLSSKQTQLLSAFSAALKNLPSSQNDVSYDLSNNKKTSSTNLQSTQNNQIFSLQSASSNNNNDAKNTKQENLNMVMRDL